MANMFILEDKNEFKLVDADGNVLATEKKSVALSTDASGHEHDEGGKFTSGSHAAHQKTSKAINAHRAINKDAAQNINQASYKAHKAAAAKDHKSAYEHHGKAAKLHRNIAKQAAARNDHRVARVHEEAADAHEDMAVQHEMKHNNSGK